VPKGPQGQWRPAGAGALAVHVCRIATGEIEETYKAPPRPDPVTDSRRASVAGKARAASLKPQRRREIATAGARARWDRKGSHTID
jgi:hypothetical protein